jgi:hypothetical protein
VAWITRYGRPGGDWFLDLPAEELRLYEEAIEGVLQREADAVRRSGE